MVSDIDLVVGNDFTEDYSEAMRGNEFDATMVKRGSFSEIFDFAYESKNAWEIYEKLLAQNKVSGDWSVATFDESTYEITKANGRYMGIYHVAIYVGNGMCVEALNTSYGVVYQRLRTTNAIMVCRPST